MNQMINLAQHEVLQLLEQHGALEGEALQAYQAIVDSAPEEDGVTYLVRIILEDEERHHRIFEEMANAFRSMVWSAEVEPKMPPAPSGDRPELLATTKRLLAFEQHDRKELRSLRRRLKGTSGSSLDVLAVEMMLHDTAKHIDMLEYIESRLS